MTQSQPRLGSLFKLEFPQTIGTYASYEEAQVAVDYLADNEFPVQNLCIVGTDLRTLERVTGRRTWWTAVLQGAQQGITMALMFGVFLWIFNNGAVATGQILVLLGLGMAISILFSVITYAATRGRKDFTSVSQTVATKYEVLCEHKVVSQARELVAGMPGARAAQFDPRFAPQAQGVQPQGLPGGYPPGYPQPYPVGYPLPYPYPVQPAYPGQPGYPMQPGYAYPAQPGYPTQSGYGSQPTSGVDPGVQPLPSPEAPGPDGGLSYGANPFAPKPEADSQGQDKKS